MMKLTPISRHLFDVRQNLDPHLRDVGCVVWRASKANYGKPWVFVNDPLGYHGKTGFETLDGNRYESTDAALAAMTQHEKDLINGRRTVQDVATIDRDDAATMR